LSNASDKAMPTDDGTLAIFHSPSQYQPRSIYTELTKIFNSPNQQMQKPFQRVLVVSLLVGALILGGCDSPNRQQAATPPSPSSPTSPNTNPNQFPGLPRLNGKATVLMTVKGNKQITIELDGNNAPISAGNFVDLVQKGFYNGLTFHRVVRQPQPFVVQGGDPRGDGSGGYVPTGTTAERRIPLEIKPKGASAPVYGQTITDAPELQHKRGTIAMARSQSPDSASSQFYFTLADIAFLDGNYAVFGKITRGLEIIDTIQKGDKITSAKVTQGIENLKK
jgi:peptidyl-prolyl cis-trans isomerase B (cyclophilin B)